jgi:superfamily II DNA or RNA helicase
VLSQLPARTDTTVYVEMADTQRGPYAEHSHTLARLLQKKYLTEIDRRRILASIANLRMLCDSTFLLDQQTNVSPKLEELEELLRELLFSGPHKVVIFSQWEKMLRLAAEVVEKLGVGYALLHGGIPGKERRSLLERFRDEGDCRVFLSTDAGGTGLNLQAADTVINLEVPWNPAVLEQRIARVHRMGQHRPVQVFNLVMRDSIEERVLRTLAVKRSLFTEIFSGTNDEVVFATLGQQAFLETVRELVGEAKPAETPSSVAASGETATDPRQAVVQAGVQFLEALAALIGTTQAGPTEANGNGASVLSSFLATDAQGRPVLQVPVPSPEILQRGASALRAIVQKLNAPNSDS